MKLDDLFEQEAKAAKSRKSDAVYTAAKARYASLGVDTDAAIKLALSLPISVHCWQGDDVRGLEQRGDEPVDAGGVMATGNYPGAARNGDELRADFEVAAGLIPGKLRFALHGMYMETGGKKVERDEMGPEHFTRWVDWAKANGWALDFNPSCFAHPMVTDGLTLSSNKKAVREFWIRHCLASREVSRYMASKLGSCVCNLWISDGRKDSTVDRMGPRARLVDALDVVYAKKLPKVVDVLESKLFGIALEDYTVGSNEFYLLYAASRGLGICFDLGHFHPTESIADKISATYLFVKDILLHCSRPIRWDSDHVTRFDDSLRAVADEAQRSGCMQKVWWSTDFFDASINRIAAWVIGTRAVRKAILWALLEPWKYAVDAEYGGDGAAKLAIEEMRALLPFGAVWDQACRESDVPGGLGFMAEVHRYEREVTLKRT
jgi:L-rhamnose isomerase